MALFVLGAGATRGASFVDVTKNSCLPPLDADFYSQLQRIKSPKHQKTINDVLKDTVELFGTNFKVTMESVFTTLEHTARMIETAGESRDFKRSELEAKKERLKQAIAATLEESLCCGQRTGEPCEYHRKIVEKMNKGDDIISFNYDCLIDESLKHAGDGKWNAHYGYGFSLGKRGTNLTSEEKWQPKKPALKANMVHLFKLHGSLHFLIDGKKIKLKERPYTKQKSSLRFTIIPPESNKRYDEGVFKGIWKQAGQAVHRAETIVIIGYSLPVTDSHANALFRISTKKSGLKSLVIVNPDKASRHRTREILRRGIGDHTRILVFDTLRDFATVDRDLWDR